jgi:hypothetical protein
MKIKRKNVYSMLNGQDTSNFKIRLKTYDTWTIGSFPFSRTLTAFPSVVKYSSTYVLLSVA